MKYSFLVPVHNKLEYIKKCFDSILSQTYDNFEVIVVDDNSNEETLAYLKKLVLKDNRVKVYFNERNLGIGQTRNRLLKYATGDYLIFVDSDDYIESKLLEEINNILLNNNQIEIVRFQNIAEPVTSNQEMIELNKNPFRFSCLPTTSIISGEDALMTWCLGSNKINTMPWTYCIKKELYDDAEYPNIPYLEDFAITHYLVAKAKKVFAIDYVGYHYLQYDSSLTKYNDDNIEERILYAKEKLKVFKKVIELTKIYINKTDISLISKKIFFNDIDKRYILREERVANLEKTKYEKKREMDV